MHLIDFIVNWVPATSYELFDVYIEGCQLHHLLWREKEKVFEVKVVVVRGCSEVIVQ